jgi:pyruvate kinase
VTTGCQVEEADAVIQTAVQAALKTEAADSGDAVVVLSGMMTDIKGMNTANMLKVHVAAETVASGRSVVDGLVSGPLYRLPASASQEVGDLSTIPDDAILFIPEGFDGEFVGELNSISGVIDANEGVTNYAAVVARELSIPMISSAAMYDATIYGSTVTLDAERGVVYEGTVNQEDISAAQSKW